MKMSAIQPGSAQRLRPVAVEAAGAWLAPAVLAALVAIAIQSLWIPVDADVSWLITVSERILSGDRLYVDILEVNPPASVWLYLPLVWLANSAGAKPEAMIVIAFAAAGVASVAATVRLASRLDDAPPPLWLASAVAVVALVLPMGLFAQREHAALLLALPSLAALALVAEGKRLDPRALLASGVAAGAIVVIKPYFLLAVLIPGIWALWKRRSISPFLVPGTAAIAVIAAYGIAILLFEPSYFAWVPVIAHSYAPVHDVLWKVVLGPALYPAICVGLAVLLRSPRIPSLTVAWSLAAAGFLAAAFIQGKNYPNHWLPEAGLALCAVFAVMPLATKSRRIAVTAALAFVALCEMYQWTIRPDPAVASAIRRVAPPEPKIVALSPQLTTGHPVTRNVGGQWVGSSAGQYIAGGARYVGLKDDAARDAYRRDIQSFATDVARRSPDVVLVDRSSKAWMIAEPAVAAAMAGYKPAARTKETEIWVRRRAAR